MKQNYVDHYGNLEIFRTEWFGGKKQVGIIFTKDIITKEIKVFVGAATGYDMNEDIFSIIDFGAKMNGHYAAGYFKGLSTYIGTLVDIDNGQ